MRKSWLPLNSVLPNSNVLILNDHQCNICFESSTKLPSLYQILSVWNTGKDTTYDTSTCVY